MIDINKGTRVTNVVTYTRMRGFTSINWCLEGSLSPDFDGKTIGLTVPHWRRSE